MSPCAVERFLGIEPTGRTIEMQGIVLWRIADGQLAERWAVLDYDALLRAIQDGP